MLKTLGLKTESPHFHGCYQAIHLSEKISANISTLDSGFSYLNHIYELNGSQSVVPEPPSSVSCENLVEMKIGVLPQAYSTAPQTRDGAQQSSLPNYPDGCLSENHC